jgi:hypothetical protein
MFTKNPTFYGSAWDAHRPLREDFERTNAAPADAVVPVARHIYQIMVLIKSIVYLLPSTKGLTPSRCPVDDSIW